MIGNDFREWLIEEAQYADKSAGDVLSRCRRVERIFGIRLNKTANSKQGRDKICDRLRSEADSYLKPGVNKTTSVSIIVSAVRLYHNFLNA